MSKATLRVDDIDILISPDGCWGLPHDACLNWKIPIIFITENKNIYKNHKKDINNCIFVDSYLEAAGIIQSIKAGVTTKSISRLMKELK
jgi:hypothetical protein